MFPAQAFRNLKATMKHRPAPVSGSRVGGDGSTPPEAVVHRPPATLSRLLAAGALALAGAHAAAAELRVITTGAFKPVLVALAPAFEGDTGRRLVLANDTAGGAARRVAAGEAFDVVVLTPGGLDELARAGRVVPDSRRPLARVGIGVAVKRGAPLPDISTADALRQTLLGARAVAYVDPAAGGSSGIYLARLFERWGIAAQIAPKAVLVPGALAAQRLVSGEADVALQQMSELLAVPGAVVVGPIPAEVQKWTVYAGAGAGAVGSAAAEPAAAQALLDRLSGGPARAALQAIGMQAP